MMFATAGAGTITTDGPTANGGTAGVGGQGGDSGGTPGTGGHGGNSGNTGNGGSITFKIGSTGAITPTSGMPTISAIAGTPVAIGGAGGTGSTPGTAGNPGQLGKPGKVTAPTGSLSLFIVQP
jgi:hypothetical protein